MRYLLLFVTMILLFSQPISAQTEHQDRELLIYNTAFGGLSSGIGAVINKPKGSNWRKVFIQGLWQGSIGGLLNYSGKKTLYLINKNDQKLWAWPANILHYAGVSIIENAALNEPFLQNWHYEFGPVRFDFSRNGKKSFRARFLPEIVYAIYIAGKQGGFDFKNTVQTGHFIFTNKETILVDNNDQKVEGFSMGRAIAIGTEWIGTDRLIAHEIGHQFQYSEYHVFNTWLKPFEKKVKTKFLKTFFLKYFYFDFPYFWIPYNLQGSTNVGYKNFFEFEAQRFATNAYVPR